MPAPDKMKKPKKLDKGKGKKGELGKKKKSSGNLMIILSVVGVVVLLGVGITIFFLMSGNDKPLITPSGNNAGQQAGNVKGGAEQPGNPPGDGNVPPVDIAEINAKFNDLIDKLADKAKKEEAARALKDMLEGDLIKKVPDGRNLLLAAIMTKAKAGNEGATDFLKQLARDTSNASLAQMARKMYDDNLRKENEQTLAAELEAGEEPTQFIPNKADVVFSMLMSKFLETEFHRAVFTTGAFRQEDVYKRLGVPANTVEHFIVSGMKDFNQVAAVVRTTAPMNWDDVKKTMHLEEAGTTIKGKTYYLGKVDFMTEFLGQRIPGVEALRDKAAFWRVDPRTFVYADETTMKDLLENPPEKDKSTAPPQSSAGLPGGNTPGNGAIGNDVGNAGGGGRGAGAMTLNPGGEGGNPGNAGGGGRGAGATTLNPGGEGGNPGNAGGGRGAGATTLNPGGDGGVTGGAGGEPASGSGNAGDQTKALSSGRPERFMTIDAKMRRLIKLTENATQDSLVLFVDKATSKIPVLMNYVKYLDQLPSTKSREIDTLVVILPSVTGSPSLRVGLACKSRSVVRDISAEVEKVLSRISKEDLRDLFGFEFKLIQSSSAQDSTSGAGGGPGGTGGVSLGGDAGGGGRGRGVGGVGGINLGGGDSGGGGRGRGAGGVGGVSLGGDASGGSGGRGRGAGGVGGITLGGDPGGGRGEPPAGSGATASSPDSNEPGQGGQFNVERSDEYIIVIATMHSSLTEFIDKHMKGWMQQIRGSQEMASGKFRLGDLGASLEYYKNDLVRNNRPIAFPQGAYPRTFDSERGSRPYPASERISFLRELLPYLGDDRYYGLQKDIDPEQSWKTGSNLNYARILVPHFLNPSVGPTYNYVKVRGVDTPVAATHFVGMAGVGPDAAYLPKTDPRAGIFGYDRQTSPDDVKDGLSNTIFMIEADKALLGPWLQGGGATVRGTSVAGNDVGRRGGFSSPTYSGKEGAWVLMADGSARFLTKDISPDIFKALCTMAGSDSAGAIDLIATKANLEVTPRTETASAISTQRKKKIVEEEEVPVKK